MLKIYLKMLLKSKKKYNYLSFKNYENMKKKFKLNNIKHNYESLIKTL